MLKVSASPPQNQRHWLASRLPFFYGWVMVPVAMLALVATSPGQTFGVSIFNPAFQESLGLSLSLVTGAYMVGTLLAAIPQPYVGSLMDRFGIRRMMFVVVIGLGLACLFMSQVQNLLMLFMAFFLLRLLGQGALSLLANNVLAMWFRQRLGRVSGFMNVGMAGGTAVLPTAILWLINQFGWRWAYAILGISVCLIMLPILAFIFRNRPEDVGQSVDGLTMAELLPTVPATEVKAVSKQLSLDLKAAQGTPAYWIFMAVSAAWAMIATAIFFNIVPFFTSNGLTELQAATTFSILAVASGVTEIIGGFLADRWPLRYLIAVALMGFICSLLFLVYLSAPWHGQAYALVWGLSHGLLSVSSAIVWVRYYGREHLGKIRGSVWTAVVAGSSAGPFIMGFTFDLWGSYRPSLWFFILLFVPVVVAVFWAKPPVVHES